MLKPSRDNIQSFQDSGLLGQSFQSYSIYLCHLIQSKSMLRRAEKSQRCFENFGYLNDSSTGAVPLQVLV